jgi:hypothetical protein
LYLASNPRIRIALAALLLIGFAPAWGAGRTIKIPAWVSDPSGKLLLEAPPTGFEAWLDAEPAPIRNVQTPDGNLVLLLVTDVVGDLIRIEAARKAIVDSFGGFGPKQYTALLQAQDGLQVVQDPTTDREAFSEKLLSLPVSGLPGLLESLPDAVAIGDSMLAASQVRVAILYVTDGSIYEYRGDYTNPVINPSDHSDLSRRFRDRLVQERIQRTLDSLAKAWTPVFFLHLENRQDDLNVVYQNGLSQFASTTGGQALFCNSVAQIPAFLNQLVERISGLYTLTIETPAALTGRLGLRIAGPPEVIVTSRQSLEISPPEKPKKKGRTKRK